MRCLLCQSCSKHALHSPLERLPCVARLAIVSKCLQVLAIINGFQLASYAIIASHEYLICHFITAHGANQSSLPLKHEPVPTNHRLCLATRHAPSVSSVASISQRPSRALLFLHRHISFPIKTFTECSLNSSPFLNYLFTRFFSFGVDHIGRARAIVASASVDAMLQR